MKSSCWYFGIVALIACGCSTNTKFRLEFGEQEILTEEAAVRLSQQALTAAGIDATRMRPVPYRTGNPDLFARNTLDPDSGYVIWKSADDGSGYSVTLRRSEAEVAGSICPVK